MTRSISTAGEPRFVWGRPASGYKLIPDTDMPAVTEAAFLVPRDGRERGQQVAIPPGTYLEFSRLPVWPEVGQREANEAYLAFANRYGLLGHLQDESGCLLQREATHLDWPAEINDMRAALATLSSGDSEEKPALAEVVNARIRNHVGMTLEWTGQGWRRSFAANNLRGELWLQLLDAITENRGFGTCTYCGGAFEIPPKAEGKGKLYCSGRCRVGAFKNRKKEAQR
ncbi:MAG: hypothetical protein AMXMBFR33_41240 [Candidatus Xenobia bacterium]